MIRSIIGGAVAAALLSVPTAVAAPDRTPSKSSRSPPLAWVIAPTEAGCRAELELSSRSGAVTPVSLVSDGQLVSLRFFKAELPSRAFLPLRVDRARFSNLMIRGDDGSGELVLSEETEAAMRRGGVLGVAWLTDEPLTGSLAGSERGLADLRVCGAQVARRQAERRAAETAERERAEAESRTRALTEAQLAAIQAQTAAAEAQRRQVEESAERQRRVEAAAAEQAYMEARQRAYEDERRRIYEEERRRAWEAEQHWDAQGRWAPARPSWPRPQYPYERD